MTVQTLERPQVQRIGDLYQLTWPVTGVQVAFDRLTENRDGLFAEIVFARCLPNRPPGLLLDVRMNLLSASTKAQVARSLGTQLEDIDWPNLLETACYLVKRRHRDGDPAVDLAGVEAAARAKWVLHPYLESDRPAVLFAAGGTGKTMLALAMAVSCATTTPVIGAPASPARRALVLDYESDRYVHHERVQAICTGAGLGPLPAGRIYHRRMDVPLVVAAPAIRREIATLSIGLVLVDSLAQAAGELEESAPIIACFGAIRSFGVPVLVLSHVTKATMDAEAEGRGRHRLSPFGSIFTLNSAGNAWSLRRRGDEQETDGSLLLVHEKTNNDRYQPRHAYRASFLQEADQADARLLSVHYEREEYAEAFADHLPLTERLVQLLDRDGPRAPAELLESLSDVKEASARATLSKLVQKGRIIQLQDRRYALHAANREPNRLYNPT